jgi:hypothetical protein
LPDIVRLSIAILLYKRVFCSLMVFGKNIPKRLG